MSKKNVNVKKKPDPPERPSKERDEAYFKVLTDWLASNGGSFEGMGSDQTKWYRANYPKYAPTQSATGNETVTVEPWKPTGGKHSEIDKGYEREQRKIASFLRSDTYRNSLPFDQEDIDYKRKYHGKELEGKSDQEIDSLIRNDFIANRLKTLYDTFDLRLASPEDANDGAKAYWDPENNVMSFDNLNPELGTFQEELAHRSGLDEMHTKDTIPGIDPSSLDLKDFNLTGRNLDLFKQRDSSDKPLPNEHPIQRGYMADNRERRAKQYVTRQALGNLGYDPNGIMPLKASDDLGDITNYYDIPGNAAGYYDYYYEVDKDNINKFAKGGYMKKGKKLGLGGTIGSTIGAASNLALPGLGTVLSPILTGIGNKIDERKMTKDSRNAQFSAIQETDNPYGYAMGGMMTDPPLQARGMAQESTGVNKPLIDYTTQKPMRPYEIDNVALGLNKLAYGQGWVDDFTNEVNSLNQGIETQNAAREARGEFKPQFKPLMSGGAGGSYGAGGMIQRKYGIGGALNGSMDFANYQGNKHTSGGIGVDQKGLPTTNKVNEVEGNETRFMIDGQAYIFSDQLKF